MLEHPRRPRLNTNGRRSGAGLSAGACSYTEIAASTAFTLPNFFRNRLQDERDRKLGDQGELIDSDVTSDNN